MSKPNFFVIGAPKCATTALCSYLSKHPQVFMSDPKEPSFFDKDCAPDEMSWDQYLSLFASAGPQHPRVDEGSTWYLRSAEAVPSIMAFQPDARLIAMLRNPVDMAASLHSQNIFDHADDVLDFEKAWALQFERAAGRGIPKSCRRHASLQYGWVCKLGEQVEQLLKNAPREQVMLVLYEDFAADPARAYGQVLEFLGLEPHALPTFDVLNKSRNYRSPALWAFDHFLRHPSDRMLRVKQSVKKVLGVKSFGVHRTLNNLNTRFNMSEGERKPLTAGMRQKLVDYFAEDVRKLAGILNRDLSHWLGSEPGLIAPSARGPLASPSSAAEKARAVAS